VLVAVETMSKYLIGSRVTASVGTRTVTELPVLISSTKVIIDTATDLLLLYITATNRDERTNERTDVLMKKTSRKETTYSLFETRLATGSHGLGSDQLATQQANAIVMH